MISKWQVDVMVDMFRHPKDHIIGWWGRFVLREGSTGKTAVWLPNEWRLLEVGETTQPGDQLLEFNCGVGAIWLSATAGFGSPIRHGDIPTYRRRIAK